MVTNSNLKKQEFALDYEPREREPKIPRKAWHGSKSKRWLIISPHTQEAEIGLDDKPFKSAHSDVPPSAPKGSIISKHNSTSWQQNSLISDLTGEIFHSNNHNHF